MTVANCASDCCLTCTEWKSAACKLLPTGLPRPSWPWQETQFVLYVLAAELFAGCPNPSHPVAPKKVAMAKVLASSLSDIDFHTSHKRRFPQNVLSGPCACI